MMLRRWADHSLPSSWAARARQRRFALFRELLERLGSRSISILDVGGSADFWARTSPLKNWHITVLNANAGDAIVAHGITPLLGDACALPFHDHAFDVVFSNSVLEHVADQEMMAREVRRVGRRYFVQTPNRYFPLEPHFLVPGFQFLPITVRAWLLTQGTLGWVPRATSYDEAVRTCAAVRLLSRRRLRHLFPDADLRAERISGLVKSWVAYGGWS